VSRIAEIWRYPVKSLAGERLDSCAITENGLEGDRRWALIDSKPNRLGKFLTIRQAAGLMTYSARLADGSVDVLTPDGSTRRLDESLVTTFGELAGRALSLKDRAGDNFDDAPVLIVNLATVAAFGLEAAVAVDHRRFRANLFLESLEPGEEIGWLGRRIKAGDSELEVFKRCERCVVITRDPDTTEESPELLRILTEQHDTFMGVYCRVTRTGRVSVGDPCCPI
jgi:uncharacterized protein